MGVSVVLVNHGGLFSDLVRAVCSAPRLVSIACEVAEVRDAFRLVRRFAPDILLLGVCPPGTTSVNAIRRLSHGLATRVVIMCERQEAALCVEALQAGAAGYLFVGTDAEDVVRIIRTIAAGHTPRVQIGSTAL